MIPRKLSVFFSFFPYGGNGGIANEHPSIRRWFARTMRACKSDLRIDQCFDQDFTDTPITMTRNLAVQAARAAKADLLVMCDSDQWPDLYIGQPGVRPFWDSAFDFAYDHYDKGPIVIGAPYCGPPPHENVYVFKWSNNESHNPNYDFSLEQYTREEAAIMASIHPCGALPTGLILFDLRVFDLLTPPYFYYEWTNDFQSEKASTEDVTCTRDISLAGQEILGYNPVHCNWDAWAGHVKPKVVGKPQVLTTDQVNQTLKNAVLRNRPSNEKMISVNGGIQIGQDGKGRLTPTLEG